MKHCCEETLEGWEKTSALQEYIKLVAANNPVTTNQKKLVCQKRTCLQKGFFQSLAQKSMCFSSKAKELRKYFENVKYSNADFYSFGFNYST